VGDTVNVDVDGKQRAFRVGYEDVSNPPLHPFCRCSADPVELEDLAEARAAAPADPVQPGGVTPEPKPEPKPEAATREQAEQWASDHITDGGPVSYRGISLPVANMINQALAQNLARGLAPLRSIRGTAFKKGKLLARVSTSGELEINSSTMGTMDRLAATLASGDVRSPEAQAAYDTLIARRDTLTNREQAVVRAFERQLRYPRATVGDSPADVINHEMGHHLWTKPPVDAAGRAEFYQEGKAALGHSMGTDYRYTVSAYADNPIEPNEYFAEGYAAWCRGEAECLHPAMRAFFAKYVPL
jgi:hypothetical protein